MERRVFNPTPWLTHFNLNHAVEVRNATRTVYLSGQAASAADGAPLHAGDLKAQFAEAWAQLKAALRAADMTPAHIARVNIYTVDVDRFMAEAETLVAHFKRDGCSPCCTLAGVTRLYHPDILIELEATACA
jgi:enamine deaminase RidA (YjgF/YER057c/UK114 family)